MATGNGTIQCQCGAKLRVPPNAAGRRIRCPKCEFRIQIPADGVVSQSVDASQPTAPAAPPARPKPTTPPPPPPVHEEEDSLLSDFMQAESGAEVAAGSSLEDHQTTCPSCKAAMAKSATQCLMCGHDLSKPKAPPAGKSKAKKEGTKSPAKSGGKFLVGCALSCLGALIGALVWFGVAMATDHEFGLIAIGVGMLAGGGMALGYKQPSALAGWVAVLTTVLGITGAKVLIFAYVLFGVVTGETDNVDIQREYVKHTMVELRLDEEGVWSDSQREDLWDEYYDTASEEIDDLTDAQVTERWKELKESEDSFLAQIDHGQIASHRATLKVYEAGAPPYGDEYDAFYNEELSALKGTGEAEVEAEMARIERWDEGECWEDPQYVRNYLVYNQAKKARDKEFERIEWDEHYDDRYAAAWKKHYGKAVAEIDGLTPEARSERAKSIEAAIDRENAEFEENLAELTEDISGGDVAMVGVALIIGFIFIMFGLFGTIFTIIAAVTAYRIASNGMT